VGVEGPNQRPVRVSRTRVAGEGQLSGPRPVGSGLPSIPCLGVRPARSLGREAMADVDEGGRPVNAPITISAPLDRLTVSPRVAGWPGARGSTSPEFVVQRSDSTAERRGVAAGEGLDDHLEGRSGRGGELPSLKMTVGRI